MGILSVDVNNPDNFEHKSFEPVPPGKYICEVKNDLTVEDSKSSDNKIVKIELVVIEPDDYKGRMIFDNLVIGATPEVKQKTEWKIAHFALACGLNKEELNEIDLDRFKGLSCEVNVGIKASTFEGETKKKNVVKQYLFNDEEIKD